MTIPAAKLRELAEPVAYLIEWYDQGDRSRVQLNTYLEAWLEADKPTIDPLCRSEVVDDLRKELTSVEAENVRLREALKPFAAKAARYDDIPGVIRTHDNVQLWQIQKNKGMEVDIEVGDLRRAKAALQNKDTTE